MITNIQLYSDPYQKEVFNILYHQVGNGQIQEHLEDRLSRLRKMPLKDSLFPNDFLGWKGLFAELYDSLRVKQASLTFYGTTQDYEMILNAYKEYENVSKNRKIEITFCIKNSKIAEDCEPKNRYEAFKNLKKIYEELNFTTDITRGLSKFWSEVSCIEQEDEVILIENGINHFFDEDRIKKFQEKLNLKKQFLEDLEKSNLEKNRVYIITLSQQFLMDVIYKKKILKMFEKIAYNNDNLSIFVVCYHIQEKEKQKIRTELKNFQNLTMIWENKEDSIWLDSFYEELENQVILRKIRKIVQIYKGNENIFLEIKGRNSIINNFSGCNFKVMRQMCDFKTLFIEENNILKKQEALMKEFLEEVNEFSVPTIFKACIDGIDGGWVEEAKAVVQFKRFSHSVMMSITERFHQLYDSISKMDESIIQDYISIFSMEISQELGCFKCNSYNEYSKNIIEYLKTIEYKIKPTHIIAKPLQNKYWNIGIASEEIDYIDLLQWETSFLMALRKDIAIIIEYWKQEKKNHQENKKKKMIKLVEEFIWKAEQQLVRLYLQYFIEQMECLGTIEEPNKDFSELLEIQHTIVLSKEELRKIENLPLYE